MNVVLVVDVLDAAQSLYKNVVYLIFTEVLLAYFFVVPDLLFQVAIGAVLEDQHTLALPVLDANVVEFDYVLMALPRQ